MAYIKTTKEKSDKLSQKSANQDLIRAGIIAELDAISLYQSQIENTDDELIKKVLEHVRDEEKEHVAELTCALVKMDPGQEKELRQLLGMQDKSKLTCLHDDEEE